MYSASIITSIVEGFTSIVNEISAVLPLEKFTDWLYETVPFIEVVDKPLFIVALAIFIIWFVISFISDTLRKNSKFFIIALLILAVAGYMGAIKW